MRLAIVHYHLQFGGVTRVIQHILSAMRNEAVSVVVLTGMVPASVDWPGDYRVIPGLLYEGSRPSISSKELAAQMLDAAVEVLGGEPDIWHVHNHSLGKNMVLPGALEILTAKGHRMLLHIHDFAEDGRPANYRLMVEKLAGGMSDKLSQLLYPQAEHIHYGVLNSRDQSYLQDAGADNAQLHLLANPVDLSVSADACPPGKYDG